MKNFAFFGYDFFYTSVEALVGKGYYFKWLFSYNCDGYYLHNDKILSLAEECGAKIYFHKPSIQDIELLIKDGCELLIVAAYKYKIPLLENGMPLSINIHPSLLPEGRGAWPMPWVILKGLNKTGVTIHELASDFDAGPVLLQKEIEISEFDDLETLSCRSQIIAKKLLLKLIESPQKYLNKSKEQGAGNYWPMPKYKDMLIDWNMTVQQIFQMKRAFSTMDFCANFDNQDWIVSDLSVWIEAHNYKLGEVIHKSNKEVVVAAKNGFVCIKQFKIDDDE